MSEALIQLFRDKKDPYVYANGKRKTSVARVRMYPGTGKIVVNGKEAKDYFSTQEMIDLMVYPLTLVGLDKKVDLSIMVEGGGLQGQAEACRHGVAKALVNKEDSNRAILKPEGFLTRDSRIKERKKFGLRRARRAPQFSKR